MILSHLLIRNFRLIEETSLDLQNGMQLFLGLNAQGKTSLIEAILFLSTSTSHRTRKEEDLIRWNTDAAFARAVIEKAEGLEKIEFGLEKSRKQIKIDGVLLPRIKDLYGHLRTVLFVPEDLQIIDGSPQDRRRFLDIAMAQLDPGYITLLQDYKKILSQRNHLLKQLQERKTALLKQLQVWNASFIKTAAQVIERRMKIVDQLIPVLEQSYAALADDGPLRIRYSASYPENLPDIETALQEKIERIAQTEIERGSSQVGPHRDDILFYLAEKNLAMFGSQGQRRAAVLALRLAQAKLFYQLGYGSPLLLIDDVVYEMDNTRRTRFWNYLDFSKQMIVTATDREHLGPGINPTQIFKVQNGTISLH